MNTAATETKRPRRTPEQVKADRVQREADLLAKTKARAERLAAEAKAAEERAKQVEQRKAEIENNEVPVRQRAEVPVIAEKTVTKASSSLKKLLKELGTQLGLDFGDLTPRLTRQGSALSLRITATVAGAAKSARHAAGATREATRFLENHKLVGIKPSVLNKEVELAGEKGKFKVMGLRGRQHDVVLQEVGTEAVKVVPAADFKTRMTMA